MKVKLCSVPEVGSSLSRVFSGSERPELTLWEAPVVYDDTRNENPRLTPEDVANIEKQAHSKGFEVGRWEGFQAAHKTIEEQVARLNQVLAALTKPFEQINSNVEDELILLAAAIAEQLIKREVSVDPGLIKVAVQEATAALSTSARHINLHLHPEDAAVLRSGQSKEPVPQQWRIVEDPGLARGDCQIDCEDELVDATVRGRIRAIVSQSFGIETDD